ncbi:MAG: VCBS repeat-containing protein [Gemmatimonadota bacterium]|nr:VCBS repeat-containing protein [Gemmatimonadota bacterium]
MRTTRRTLSDGGWSCLVLFVTSACAPSAAPEAGARRFDRSLVLEEEAETSANVSIGDVNQDGRLDIVLVKGRHWPLTDQVLLGDGAGGFQPAYPLGDAADRSYSGVLVDMDGDGDLDVVVSNDDPDPKLVHLNDGSGRFRVGSTFGRPEWSTRHVAVRDLDGDGFPDVVLANRSGRSSGMNYICFGIGDGRFSDECVGFAEESATTITPVDFNGDGALDLVVPHRDGGQSHVYLNDGNGRYRERIAFGPAEATIRAAKPADFDADGRMDLAVIDERSGPAIYMQRADGEWEAPFALGRVGEGAARPYALMVADVDTDGRTDVVIGYVNARPAVFFNDAPGTFTVVPFGDAEGSAYGFDVADVDGDGFLDIAMARSGATNMLYFGAPEAPTSNPDRSGR